MITHGSVLDRTLRRKQELQRRKQTFLWAVVNLFGIIIVYIDINQEFLSNALIDAVQVPAKWTHSIEYVCVFILGVNVVIHVLTYAKLSYVFTTVNLNPTQKRLLAVPDDAPLGFNVSPTKQTPAPKSELSPNFILSTPFNLSTESRCDFNTSSPSSSLQYYRNQPISPISSQSSQFQSTRSNSQLEYPDSFEHNKVRLRMSMNSSSNDLEENSITDEEALQKYLKEHDQKSEMKTFENPELPQSISGSFWNLGHNILDYSSQLRKYTYQLATRLPQTSISHSDSDPDFPTHMSGDDIWFRLGVNQKDLYQWTKNLRQWISLTILDRLVSEIETINDTLHSVGSTDLQIGEVSLSTLRQVLLTKSQLIPSLAVLLPYLEVSSNQEYLVQRIKELARGGCMSEFVWNGGGQFKGRSWSDHLPTDSAIIIHMFCTYLDSRLPPHPNYPDGKTFTSQCLVRSPEKPVLNKQSLYIYQTRLLPPHFKLVIAEEVWDLSKGRNNLFHTILLFLFHIKIKEKGMLGRVNLGLSGVNILWILNRN